MELRLHSFAPSSQVHACACCLSGACRYFARQPPSVSLWMHQPPVCKSLNRRRHPIPHVQQTAKWVMVGNEQPTAAESSLQGKVAPMAQCAGTRAQEVLPAASEGAFELTGNSVFSLHNFCRRQIKRRRRALFDCLCLFGGTLCLHRFWLGSL